MTEARTTMAATAESTLAEILEDGVVLCVRLGEGAPLLDVCRAAVRGGLKVLELTLTTPGALEAMSVLAREPGVVAGGGTVLNAADARSVAQAGGRFCLSPIFDPGMIDEANRLGLLAVPGTSTPTEMHRAHSHGVPMIKVFPAGTLGGPAYLRAVRGPFPNVRMLPTSGPTADNLALYFAAGASAVGIGGEVFGPGFTPASVEKAAAKVRRAVDASRSGVRP